VGDNAQSQGGSGTTDPTEEEDSEGLLGGVPGFSSYLSLVSMLGAAVLVAGGRRKD